MESLKKKVQNLPLRRFFILTVLTTFCTVVLLSGLTIWGCVAVRCYLLPEPEAVYLTVEQIFSNDTVTSTTTLLPFGEMPQQVPELVEESSSESKNEAPVIKYSIEKIEKSFDTLTPKRKLVYQASGAAMVGVPVLLSIMGILFCGFYFYRRKLSEPFRLLLHATEQIDKQDLDFILEYSCEDELGRLCRSFEQMRQALVENNKSMWELLEQRRLMQASIAHDLRNPIAIVEGYTEYLQFHLTDGKLSEEKTGRIVNNLNMAAKRLERYTESVRTLNQLEDLEINRTNVLSKKLVEDICDDFEMMASSAEISFSVTNSLPDCQLSLDSFVLYRILENIFGNALRFAKSSVKVQFELAEHKLHIIVTDDGTGFSDKVLERRNKLFLPTQENDGHLGMGLAVSRLLCEKHGGSLHFFNSAPQGAAVKMILTV